MVEIKVGRINFEQKLHMMYCLQLIMVMDHDNHQLSLVKIEWSRAMQPKIVRGPRGVQMEEVLAAADTVLSLGERPTIERVRQQLGRGSPNTVGPMLDVWYSSLAKRLQAAPNNSTEDEPESKEPIPAPVVRAAKAMWGRALQQSEERAKNDFAQRREELSVQAEALQRAQGELEHEARRLADRSAAYEVAMQARDAQIADLGKLVQDLQQQLLNSKHTLEITRAECVQLRLAANTDRRRQETRDEEHQSERARLEERALAQERRLNSEVDRSRQELKRLALQLESDNKKAAKSLSDAEDRGRELDTQLGILQIEKTGLYQELQTSHDKIKSLEAKLDERSSDMLALLGELRDRLPPSSSQDAAPPPRARKTRVKRQT
jgi:hypothetical protein